MAAGGKGGNPAVTAARLGASVRLLGAVGADRAGELALAQLREDGIDVGRVARLEGEVTGQIVHLVEPDGRRRYVEWRGANQAVSQLATAAAGHAVSRLGGRPTFRDEAELWVIARECRVEEPPEE